MTAEASSPEEPHGELTVRLLAMPADTNANGDIFGGWVLSQMDLACGIAASERAEGRVATIAVDAMTFIRPVKVGDVLCVYTSVDRVGRIERDDQPVAGVDERGASRRGVHGAGRRSPRIRRSARRRIRAIKGSANAAFGSAR